jgi:hypothetical protein
MLEILQAAAGRLDNVGTLTQFCKVVGPRLGDSQQLTFKYRNCHRSPRIVNFDICNLDDYPP